jgi:PHD/YefM family antitoxin component YafN of YafNO toxin-antitoxin module
MRTIPAREIKRRGISAVDEQLCEGPVHVIKNDEPSYVIITEVQYRELLEDRELATIMRVRESLADEAAGRVTRGTAQDLIDELSADE